MIRKAGSFAVSGLVVLGTLSPTAAGGRAVECYEKYETQAVYETVYENVVVNQGSRRVDYVPAIYGTRKRAVVISPARVAYEIVPAVTRTEYRKVRVEGGYSWEWRIIDGRKVLCKIKHKARYERVAETVIVRNEHKRRVVIPAEFGYEAEQVLIQPELRRVIDIPTSYETVARRVVVREGTSGWQRVRIRKHCAG